MTQETGQVYLEKFRAWKDSMSEDDFRQIVYAPRGILNRQQIKKLAGLSDQAIKKNPNIKAELQNLENDLRDLGVLPPLTELGEQEREEPKLYDRSVGQSKIDSTRVAQLEASNHELQVKVEKLQKENANLKEQLALHKETVDAIDDGLAVFKQCPS